MEVDLYKSISRNISILKFLAVWPSSENTILTTIWKLFLYISNFIFIVTQIISVCQNKQILENTSSLFVTLACASSMLKIVIFKYKMPQIEEIISVLSKKELQPENIKQKEILEKSIRISNLLYIFVTVVPLVSLPITILNILNDTLPFVAWFPYDLSIRKYYVTTFIWQMFTAGFIGFGSVGVDGLFSIFMIQIGSQCDILCDQLINMHPNTNLRKKLNDNIKHHQIIVMWVFIML